MPAGIGGAGSAPSPGWHFRAAEASCVATLIGIRAAALDIALDDVARWAVDHCPVVDAVRRAVLVEVEVRAS